MSKNEKNLITVNDIEYVTKADSTTVMSQIVARFDRIEEKIDRLMER
jgi:hypothetical protein